MRLYNLLVVDDEKYIANSISDMLRKEFPDELNVLTAHIPKQAIEIASEQVIDILVTDIEMPGMDGFELSLRLRELHSHLHCVLLTAYNNSDYMLKAFRHDIVDYVLKLEDSEALKDAVRKALRRVHKEKQPAGFLYSHPEPAPRLETGNEYDVLLARIFDYIEKNIDQDLSLIKIAEHVNFNSSYLSRLFKKAYGKTLSEYIWEYKLIKAKEMLSNSNLKINEIAVKLGFESRTYFARFFKRMTGITPKEYRIKFGFGI